MCYESPPWLINVSDVYAHYDAKRNTLPWSVVLGELEGGTGQNNTGFPCLDPWCQPYEGVSLVVLDKTKRLVLTLPFAICYQLLLPCVSVV